MLEKCAKQKILRIKFPAKTGTSTLNVYYMKYPWNKMADIDFRSSGISWCLIVKYKKTAGLCEWQQVNSNSGYKSIELCELKVVPEGGATKLNKIRAGNTA